jgi:hypothetical protein
VLSPIIDREVRRLEPQQDDAAVSWITLPPLEGGSETGPLRDPHSCLRLQGHHAAVSRQILRPFGMLRQARNGEDSRAPRLWTPGQQPTADTAEPNVRGVVGMESKAPPPQQQTASTAGNPSHLFSNRVGGLDRPRTLVPFRRTNRRAGLVSFLQAPKRPVVRESG